MVPEHCNIAGATHSGFGNCKRQANRKRQENRKRQTILSLKPLFENSRKGSWSYE